jgi:hypothetical protein
MTDESEEEPFIAREGLWSGLPEEIQHMLFKPCRFVARRGDKATSCNISSWQALANRGRPQGRSSAGARQSGRVGHLSLTREGRIGKYLNCFERPRPSPRGCA